MPFAFNDLPGDGLLDSTVLRIGLFHKRSCAVTSAPRNDRKGNWAGLATPPSPIIPPVEARSSGRYINYAKILPGFRRHLFSKGVYVPGPGGALSLVLQGKTFRIWRCFHGNKACKGAGARYSQAGKWCTSVCLHAADVGKTKVDGGSLRGRNLTIAWSRTLLHGKLAKLPVWKRPP